MSTLLSIFFFLLPLRGEVLKNEVIKLRRQRFTYKEVCNKMGHKHLLLLDAINSNYLDCMGTPVKVTDFCKTETGHKKNLLRGLIHIKTKKVICETGNTVLLSISCDKRDKIYCKDPKAGCLKLGNYFAHSLKLGHWSLIAKDVDDHLNCSYDIARSLELKDELKDPLKGQL